MNKDNFILWNSEFLLLSLRSKLGCPNSYLPDYQDNVLFYLKTRLNMIQEFEGLNQEEKQLLVDAIPMVTILIAGADGNIDKDELEWSKKITEIRAYNHPGALNNFYKLVGDQFSDRLEALMSSLPTETEARQQVVSDQLAKLNDVLPKLEFNYAHHLYTSLTSFAEHVAKSSGGFLGFATISKEESALINLPMINPIAS